MTTPQPPLAEPPFYLVDAPRLAQKYAAFRDAFRAELPRALVSYSYKTNTLPFIARTLHGLGCLAECVSALELELAEALGVPGDRTILNGPGKGTGLLLRSLEAGALVNLDSREEVRAVVALAREQAPDLWRVGLRVNMPRFDADLPGARSRFGITIEGGELRSAAAALRGAGVEVIALHGHVTSRTRALEHFRVLARELASAARELGDEGLEILDVGGGYGYAPPQLRLPLPSFTDYARTLREGLADGFPDLARMTVIAEPGLALVNDCVSYFAPVLALKYLGGRRVAVVDGSVQTVKPSKHAVNLPTSVLGPELREKHAPLERVDVVGYTCLEDDVIAREQDLPALAVGDVLRIDNVGAYTSGFKPQFIRARPAFYAWDGHASTLVRKEESFDEFFSGSIG